MSAGRSDTSLIGRWWWTLDHISFGCIVLLLAIGIVLAFAASPAATAHASGAGNFSYAAKQLAFSVTAVAILIAVSLLDSRQARIVAACIYALALIGAFGALV